MQTQNFEIITSLDTVWVNQNDGMCVGRFGKRAVDIHASTQEQLQGEHCKDCYSYKPKEVEQAWERFVTGMALHHGVKLTNKHRPPFVK